MSSSSYTAAFSRRNLPDLVQDSRLETEAFGSIVQHVLYETGRTAFQRRLRRTEQWVRQSSLGRGTYGTVYLERCLAESNTERLRAVKEIKKYVVAGQELDYARELEAIMKFSHSNYSHCFVQSHGWYELDDSVFITMEYLACGDLQRHLKKPLPEHEAKQVIAQVLEGLQYMHANGFVHRDLKPANIMVVTKSPHWFVKIADFGISKRRRQDVTSMNTLYCGTTGFVAPEVLGFTIDSNYTFAVDMWSLGAVAYKVLTISTPFPTPGDLYSYVHHHRGFPTRLLQDYDVSEAALDFIATLMTSDPIQRPTAHSAAQHTWLEREPSHVMEDHLPGTDSISPYDDTVSSDPDMEFTMASNAWSTNYVTARLETVTLQAEAPKHSSYKPPAVSEHLEEDGEALPTLPFDSPILLEEVDPIHSELGGNVYGVSRIIIRDTPDSRTNSGEMPIANKAPPSAEVLPTPPLSTDIPVATCAEDASPRHGAESDGVGGKSEPKESGILIRLHDSKEENEDEGYNSFCDCDECEYAANDGNGKGDGGKKRRFQKVYCRYCSQEFRIREEGPGELLPCEHWVCHGCLIACVAYSLISTEDVPTCCEEISLQVFRKLVASPKVQAAWKFLRSLTGKWTHKPWWCSKGHLGEPIWDREASTNYLKASCGSCDTSSTLSRLGLPVWTDFCVFCKREGGCHCAAERHITTNLLMKRMVFMCHTTGRLISYASAMENAIRCGKYYDWDSWEEVKEYANAHPRVKYPSLVEESSDDEDDEGDDGDDGEPVVSETQEVGTEDRAKGEAPNRNGSPCT